VGRPVFLKVELTEEQQEAINKAITHLFRTALDVTHGLNLPDTRAFRMIFTEIMLRITSIIARLTQESVSEADAKIAEMLGIETSP